MTSTYYLENKSTRGNKKATVTAQDATKGAAYNKLCISIFLCKCGSSTKYLPSFPHLDGSILQISAYIGLLNLLHVAAEDAKSILYLVGLK